ncbi:MAG: hypothetical protein KGL40_12970 [Rhodocyclaceae bacterium]|nr:hypothetical protein [Rhodocyclaceae bacterium]
MFKYLFPLVTCLVVTAVSAQSEAAPAPVYDPQGRLIPYDAHKPEPQAEPVPPPRASAKASPPQSVKAKPVRSKARPVARRDKHTKAQTSGPARPARVSAPAAKTGKSVRHGKPVRHGKKSPAGSR